MAQERGQSAREPPWLAAEREHLDGSESRGTIPELFEERADRQPAARAQLYKGGVYDRTATGIVPEPPAGEYGSLTYGELGTIVRNLATGFRELGLDRGVRTAIFASTRMEWAWSDLALLAAGCVVTTVYTDSSEQQVRYLLDDPGARGVIVENDALLERVFAVEDDLDLSVFVLLDEPADPCDREDVYTLGEVHELGADAFDADDYRRWLADTDPGDLASLIYTSGTTGKPKGVKLTHRNFRANVGQLQPRIGAGPDAPDRLSIDSDTVTISFLPMAHVFERLAGHFLMLTSGATVGYAESPDTISEDIGRIQPTMGASVPRVYERIFDRMRTEANAGAASVVTKPIFEWSLGVAKTYARTEDPGPLLRAKHALADRLVYSEVSDQLGGRIEFMVSGGGSLSPDLAWLFLGMGIPIVEGYGLTETAPVISVNSPEHIRPGTLGPPLVGIDVYIDESRAPQEEFEDADGTVGELVVRGDNVSDGYWQNPGATERAFTSDPFDQDGGDGKAESGGTWFRTGDIVERTEDGFLVFKERIKQLLVLSTGKNVAPGPIEDRFATNDRVEQIMVVGDDRRFVGALIVPNVERVRSWAETEDIDLPESREALCGDQRVIEWVDESIQAVNRGLGRIEKIKRFELVPGTWTAENDMLTPSMKKKRRNILDAHDDLVAELYEE